MLLRAEVLEAIRTGAIDLGFRRWQRPSVRAGDNLLTPLGPIERHPGTLAAQLAARCSREPARSSSTYES